MTYRQVGCSSLASHNPTPPSSAPPSCPGRGSSPRRVGMWACTRRGVIEHGGYQVIELAACLGKVTAEQLDICALAWERDANRDHMV